MTSNGQKIPRKTKAFKIREIIEYFIRDFHLTIGTHEEQTLFAHMRNKPFTILFNFYLCPYKFAFISRLIKNDTGKSVKVKKAVRFIGDNFVK